MKKIFIGVLLLATITIGALTHLGVVPILSPIVAKARDLGIKNDPALVEAFDEQHGMKNELPNGVVPEDREPNYSGKIPLDIILTSEEVTSILSYWKDQYPKTPIRDVQVRLNLDGSAESSGILEVSTAIVLAKQLGYSNSDIEKGKSYVKYVAGDLPFYISGQASVTNDQVSITPTKIEVGKLNVPSSLIDPLTSAIEDTIERRMSQVPELHVEKLENQAGKLHLVGTSPDTIK